MTDPDQHSAFANGVTNAEVDAAYTHYLGALMADVEKTWVVAGPPSWESYVFHVESSFGAGFGAGYRRAHIDCTYREEK